MRETLSLNSWKVTVTPIYFYLAAMLLFAALGSGCGRLSKNLATICAGVFCGMLVAGVVFVKKMSWLPDWAICDTANLLQGNWYAPPAIGLMALALSRARRSTVERGATPDSLWRAAVLFVAMFSALAWAGVRDLSARLFGPERILAEIGTRPEYSVNGVVLQSTIYTCGPASCANLLRLRGIDPAASERPMIPLCRTQQEEGVSVLNMAAGLKLATAGMGWRIRLHEPSFEELQSLPLPAIVTVGQPFNEGHVVVLDAMEAERVRIADPADKDGLVWWTMEEFKKRYLREAVTMDRNER